MELGACLGSCLAYCLISVLNVTALVDTFNQEKVGASSMITNLHVDLCLEHY